MRPSTLIAAGSLAAAVMTSAALALFAAHIQQNHRLALGNRRAVVELCENRRILLDLDAGAIAVVLGSETHDRGAALEADRAFVARFRRDAAELATRTACQDVQPARR